MAELQPPLERLAELHRVDPGRPVALLELVRYAAPTARDAYPDVLTALGGRVELRARPEPQLVGSDDERWDDFLVVGFRSRGAFVEALRGAPALDDLLRARRCLAASPGPRALPLLARFVGGLLGALPGGVRPRPPDEVRSEAPALTTLATRGLGPTPAQLETFLAGPACTPLVMVNLLAYRARAHYASPVRQAAVSGREAYQRYGRGILPLLLRLGGRPLFLGRAETTLVGEPESWHEIAVIGYPSRAHFLGMVTSPAYQAFTHHRDAGLARTELIPCALAPRLAPS